MDQSLTAVEVGRVRRELELHFPHPALSQAQAEVGDLTTALP